MLIIAKLSSPIWSCLIRLVGVWFIPPLELIDPCSALGELQCKNVALVF